MADPIDCEECLLTFCCPDCLEQHFAVEHADRGEEHPDRGAEHADRGEEPLPPPPAE